MTTETTSVRRAFDNLLEAVQADLEKKFESLESKAKSFEAKIKEKRLETLAADLAELDKRKNTTQE